MVYPVVSRQSLQRGRSHVSYKISLFSNPVSYIRLRVKALSSFSFTSLIVLGSWRIRLTVGPHFISHRGMYPSQTNVAGKPHSTHKMASSPTTSLICSEVNPFSASADDALYKRSFSIRQVVLPLANGNCSTSIAQHPKSQPLYLCPITWHHARYNRAAYNRAERISSSSKSS